MGRRRWRTWLGLYLGKKNYIWIITERYELPYVMLVPLLNVGGRSKFVNKLFSVPYLATVVFLFADSTLCVCCVEHVSFLPERCIIYQHLNSSSCNVRLGFWMLPNFQILCTGSEKQYYTKTTLKLGSMFESTFKKVRFFSSNVVRSPSSSSASKERNTTDPLHWHRQQKQQR